MFCHSYKKTEGFIQIPILIIILAGIIVFGSGGYLGIKKYRAHQQKIIEQYKIEQVKNNDNDYKEKITEFEKKLGALEKNELKNRRTDAQLEILRTKPVVVKKLIDQSVVKSN